MDDLISRPALMKEFADFVKRSNNSDFADTPTWNDAVSLVGSMPSAQPEPCEDAVSREAVLDKAYAYGNGLEPDGFCVDVEDIQALPPVTPKPEQQWIPCSERLPKENGDYLVTGRQGAVNKRKYEDGRWYGNWAVVAWMPLPEPWKGEDNE